MGDHNARLQSLRRRRRLLVPGLHSLRIPSAAVDQHPKRPASVLMFGLSRTYDKAFFASRLVSKAI